MTVLEVIQSATGYLEKYQVESPRLHAEHLLAHVLGQRRLELYMEFDRILTEQERAPLRELVKRRIAGEPLQHLLGEWDFYGRTFVTDKRALIPRPETELLVENILARLPASDSLRIADIGTGTGAIAISLAIERPNWQLTACDISADALALAKSNAERHKISLLWFQGDLLPPEQTWNAIVANLPYIPTTEIAKLSAEVQRDPVLALDGGSDGLETIRRLILDAPAVLEAEGMIFLEFGQGQSTTVEALLMEAGFSEIKITSDYQGIPRIAEAIK